MLQRWLDDRIAGLPVPLALTLPSGKTVGESGAPVRLHLTRYQDMLALAFGQVGRLGEAIVEGHARLEGSMRAAMQAVVHLRPDVLSDGAVPLWRQPFTRVLSWLRHSRARDAEQIRFHYDVSDAFYALWLDPRRVYSCAYYADPGFTLAQAQEAKLDHICRKLALKPGERFLDIGAGWGGLLLWAAEHYGVDATGITLSQNQFDHVTRLIADKGLQDRVRVMLCDYRDLAPEQPFDKIASVGMFEHVGLANMPVYCATLFRLLRPGGLLMNHGITASGLDNAEVGAGLSDFVERYIFPGGELLHVSRVLRDMAAAGLEMVDTENLRPHYAKTLWAWSDALEAQLEEAERLLTRASDAEHAGRVLRAYRLYLSGCAVAFEQGWVSLHQILVTRPDGKTDSGVLRGAQSDYPFQRRYIYETAGA